MHCGMINIHKFSSNIRCSVLLGLLLYTLFYRYHDKSQGQVMLRTFTSPNPENNRFWKRFFNRSVFLLALWDCICSILLNPTWFHVIFRNLKKYHASWHCPVSISMCFKRVGELAFKKEGKGPQFVKDLNAHKTVTQCE